LLDDAGIGGVTRCLADQTRHLSNGFRHEIMVVDTAWRLPKRIRADIVVVHFTVNWSKLPFMAALRARLGRRPLVIVEHSYTEAYERLRVSHPGRFRTMLKMNFAFADRVVAVSRAQAAWLTQCGIVKPHRLVAIPQALDTSSLSATPPLVRRDGPIRLGAYGRYAPQKGFDVLIEAMRQVHPAVATLTLRGLGPDLQTLRHAAAGLPHVTVAGAVTDLPAYLESLDAVVIPSRWEAFGLVGAEARAAGRPILAARTDGLVEQAGSDAGILFPAEDPTAIAAAIRGLAERDLGAMGERGRCSVRGEFGATIAGWTALLNDLASARAA
jgi:glycosyltransferase involved in cell wall biosynthesis